MFTGIIETLAEVVDVQKDKNNLNISLRSEIAYELSVDQSIAHNGACLTVVSIKEDVYVVTVIQETLEKTNLNQLSIGDKVNIERALKLGERIDGHIVQGHVDQIAQCINIKDEKGSYIFTFKYENSHDLTVEKGSVCVNGVSLTVVGSQENNFSVAIIPYTFTNTNFYLLKKDSFVNIEFDILGKYISKITLNNS